MVLRAFSPCEDELSVLTARTWPHGLDRFLWTVDVAHILATEARGRTRASPRPRVTYYSTFIGDANPAHRQLAYYAADFDELTARLPAAFTAARDAGVAFAETHISLDDVRAHLERGAHIIVLINAQLVACSRSGCARGEHSARDPTSVYVGHYVVVTGMTDEGVHVLDPAIGACDDGCLVDIASFERARAAAGTDSDCIIVEAV